MLQLLRDHHFHQLTLLVYFLSGFHQIQTTRSILIISIHTIYSDTSHTVPVDLVDSQNQRKEGRHQDKDLSLQLHKFIKLIRTNNAYNLPAISVTVSTPASSNAFRISWNCRGRSQLKMTLASRVALTLSSRLTFAA